MLAPDAVPWSLPSLTWSDHPGSVRDSILTEVCCCPSPAVPHLTPWYSTPQGITIFGSRGALTKMDVHRLVFIVVVCMMKVSWRCACRCKGEQVVRCLAPFLCVSSHE
jgi:hypothetical protein